MRFGFLIAALTASLAGTAACTQDFDTFQVVPSSTMSGGNEAGAGRSGGEGAAMNSSSGGEGGGAASGSCQEKPSPPGTDCPFPCTSCNSGECQIDCSLTDCEDGIQCPDDFACLVLCNAEKACEAADIQCPSTYACKVDCSADDSCELADVFCSSGVCELDCSAADDACKDAVLNCPANKSCTATCAAGITDAPDVECGSTCPCITSGCRS